MATCKHDAIRGGLDELTVDKLMENVQVSDKSAKDLVEDLVNEQVEATFQERSNVVNINRGRRFIENAKVTAENTKRPFKKFWKYFFDDKNSVGVRVTTRIQRRLADIASETNIPIHDFFKLIEGSIIDRVNDRRFRDAFINEMMSEGNSMVSGNKIAFQVASAVKRQQAIQLAESRKY